MYTSPSYDESTSKPQVVVAPPRTPANYFSELPVRIGAFAGLMGSVTIIAILAGLTVSGGEDVWTAPRAIASAFLGEGAATGFFPVILGTIVHLISGTMYGALFAYVTPRMPRAFWVVTGMMFGVAIWVIALIGLPVFIEPVQISETTYFNVLLISHIVFGLVLGIAGALYGFREGNTES